ncbi:AMP-binding protein [Variovorax ginsengisoli]|uniref:Acyl-coenzyme A synthetase/AMP-(Fatty) acid ligase n=1 Tax=Variovorax ginsengisoli TaxID=363844 RepID=A0ABT9SBB2_9BURK|nr:class I adenylate-forming enzyme family protein [Variovorax ginsengisoli]MDP9901051.1 acyl-coenzyme A synthetase/AMP-(fatty) acid ligase [Variovorax ginsengisoli]
MYFDRPTLAPQVGDGLGAQLRDELFGDEPAYARFVEAKYLRPNYDGYAAFEPFNESTRAWYGLLAEIRAGLQPGQPILDLWGRTGWSGASLAAMFPDHPVYMVWEGDRNVLGYKGYRYWLGQGARAANLHIVFSDLEKPLPFADGFFGLVHGLDTLHRYSPSPLVAECLRVSMPTAPLVFAHIHLSNSEPVPFFERGCTQHHGRDYRRFMDVLERSHGRRAYLLSEATLFDNTACGDLVDDHDMAHYNALLYVAPVGVQHSRVTACDGPLVPIDDDTQVILNPLVRIDAVSGVATVDRTAMAGQGAHLLERHPVYEKRLRRLLPLQLDDLDRQLLYGVEQSMALSDIRGMLDLSVAEMAGRLATLQSSEICACLPVGAAMARLQRFYRTQRAEPPLQRQPEFRQLWHGLAQDPPTEPLFVSTAQEVAYEWGDVQPLVDTLHLRLLGLGLQPGDRILVCADQHPAYLLTIWAAWLTGLVVVPVCPQSQRANLGYIVDLIRPVLCFTDAGVALPAEAAPWVVFDPLNDGDATSSAGAQLFSDWLDAPAADVSPRHAHHETAAILLSSGTTGRPKAIAHSFANLLRGSVRLAQFYQLEPGTRVLSAGGFHSMSGLRNAAVLPLLNRQPLLLTDGACDNMAMRFLAIARQWQPQVVFSAPALVDALARMQGRLEPQQTASIQTWLCTGASVSHALLARLSASLGIRFASYYGLTETGGFCAGTRLGQACDEGDLGEPVGALFRLVDSAGGVLVGEGVGQLQVFSDQLMLGYVTSQGIDALPAGAWFPTGDQVRRETHGGLVLLGRGEDEFSTASGELFNLNALEVDLRSAADIPFALLHDGVYLTLVLECDENAFETLRQGDAVQALLAQLQACGAGVLSELRIRRVAEIARTGNGKIRRSALRQQISK